MRLLEFFEAVTRIVLRSMFMYGFSWARRGSTILQLMYLIASFIVASRSPILLAPIVFMLLLYYYVSGLIMLLAYSTLLALIPSSWMALTEAIIEVFSSTITPMRVVGVFLRAFLYAIIVFSFIHMVNLEELSFLLYKTTRRFTVALLPLITWRAISLLLKESWEIMHVHKLKGEPVWKTLALIILRAEELGDQFEEGIHSRIDRCSPRVHYSLQAIGWQFAIASLSILLLFLHLR